MPSSGTSLGSIVRKAYATRLRIRFQRNTFHQCHSPPVLVCGPRFSCNDAAWRPFRGVFPARTRSIRLRNVALARHVLLSFIWWNGLNDATEILLHLFTRQLDRVGLDRLWIVYDDRFDGALAPRVGHPCLNGPLASHSIRLSWRPHSTKAHSWLRACTCWTGIASNRALKPVSKAPDDVTILQNQSELEKLARFQPMAPRSPFQRLWGRSVTKSARGICLMRGRVATLGALNEFYIWRGSLQSRWFRRPRSTGFISLVWHGS